MATVVTDAGKAIITGRIKGSGTEPRHVAWGTGAGTAGASDTELFDEAAEDRTPGTSSQETTDTTGDTYQVVGTIASLSEQTITNAGLFDASTGGTLFVKGDFAAVDLLEGEGLQFTIKVQLL